MYITFLWINNHRFNNINKFIGQFSSFFFIIIQHRSSFIICTWHTTWNNRKVFSRTLVRYCTGLSQVKPGISEPIGSGGRNSGPGTSTASTSGTTNTTSAASATNDIEFIHVIPPKIPLKISNSERLDMSPPTSQSNISFEVLLRRKMYGRIRRDPAHFRCIPQDAVAGIFVLGDN